MDPLGHSRSQNEVEGDLLEEGLDELQVEQRMRTKNIVSVSSQKMEQDGGVDSSPTTKSTSQKRRRKTTEKKSLYDIDHRVKDTVKGKANEIDASLKRNDPTLITTTKLMSCTDLAPGASSMKLPKKFCNEHMPEGKKSFWVKVGNGEDFLVDYNGGTRAISGGWKAFAFHHKLEVGDALVFQLIPPSQFQVHIVRANASKEVANASEEVDAQRLLKLNAIQHEPSSLTRETEENNDTNDSLLDHEEDHNHNNVGNDDGGGNGWLGPDMCFENLSDSNTDMAGPIVDDFERVKRFQDFKIVANGSVINDKVSELHLSKYHNLCLSQRSFLHRDLLEGFNVWTIAGTIIDICDIADAIRAMSKVVPKKDLQTWGSKLKVYEKMGVNVGFLLVRLRKLELLADKANGYERLMKERDGMKEELQNLEEQVGRVKEKLERVEKEIDKLGVVGGGSIDRDFQELANAPW
ncbi:unnamed protein product [Linum trigynum]|uniref:TF-B3 domain-containing protein n=1 Tax=Linum trigynum TaxID=586398 RepID=A0AAV2EV51_9ROSI